MSSTAASRTCNTPELLEMILMECTTVDVTRARQVNSFFKGLIDDSLGLRRVMFLEPTVGPEVQQPVQQPPAELTEQAELPDWNFPHAVDCPCCDVIIHPFFGTTVLGEVILNSNAEMIAQSHEYNMRDMMAWPRGPWEKMLIVKSPRESVTVRYHMLRPGFGGMLDWNATMGDLRRATSREGYPFGITDVFAELEIVDMRQKPLRWAGNIFS
ncbi:uncharacterized protein RCC_01644 [Ramularia collo-cygni]|uniref:F-box domain-containing protein n=1 Tax=Ramularia collo-cygni TaxID=112498 RepID=A0A2D3USW0_9PEZI|nr:uncharacterized protein RCC_01644 [Ramularia collo-cygni]CZT15810.1 uncharacterized protein RCC_01644 [Ramularia collo-cygni]